MMKTVSSEQSAVSSRGQKKASARDGLWKLMRAARQFTVTDLALDATLDRSSVNAYVRCLAKAGYIEHAATQGKGGQAAPVYRLARDSAETPRVREDGSQVTKGAGRAQMWRSMKILKSFTLTDLLAASCTEEHPVAREESITYVRYLSYAGYLRKTDARPLEQATFRLVRWTGPKPPRIQRVHSVYDPNTKEVVWPRG